MSDDDPAADPSTDETDDRSATAEEPSTTEVPDDADNGTPGEGEVYCRDCGAVISEKAEICPNCGVRQQPAESSVDDLIEVLTNGENPFVAAVYSAVLPGLGQFYNREPKKGAIVLIATMVATLSIVGIVLLPVIWLYAVYDAYVVADGREPPL
jgi:RNA polymerase subunit RPABC4/transcription elongation factor Spt4